MFRTNVKYNQKYTTEERLQALRESVSDDKAQDSMEAAKARRRNKERVSAKHPLLLEAQDKIRVVVDGEDKEFDNIALAHELERVVEVDESVQSLLSLAIRMVEDISWPFKGSGCRAGFRPEFPDGVWEHVFEYGMYCMRCFNRHESEFPDKCTSCGLTSDKREAFTKLLEERKQIWHTAQKVAAENERLSRIGLVYPTRKI